MARIVTTPIVPAQSLPWIWTTLITCPRCATTFYLTPEDTMIGIVNQIGTTGTLALGWRQLVEGDPATAAIDTAHLHVDPAQVVGPCPWCGYNPVVQRGPRYGLPKITLNVDPTTSAMQDWVNLGVVGVGYLSSSEGWLVGILQNASSAPFQLDPTSAYAAAVRRRADGSIDAATPYDLHAPGQHRTPTEASQIDPALVAYCAGFGLVAS